MNELAFAEKQTTAHFLQTPSYYDIMYPAWSFWAGGPAIATEPTGIGRWDLKRESLVAASEEWPWERKRDVGFFRGSRWVKILRYWSAVRKFHSNCFLISCHPTTRGFACTILVSSVWPACHGGVLIRRSLSYLCALLLIIIDQPT